MSTHTCDETCAHTIPVDGYQPPIECRICTKPLMPSEVDDHIASHGWAVPQTGDTE